MGSRSISRTAVLPTLLISGIALTAAADTPRVAGGDAVMGMTAILTREAHYNGADDCPDIEIPNTKTWLEHYATPEQRERLSKPGQNEDELRRMASYAPGDSNICT